jgi:hypothetical protein
MTGISNPMVGRLLPLIEETDGGYLPDIAHDKEAESLSTCSFVFQFVCPNKGDESYN